jgi:hypothetical protein
MDDGQWWVLRDGITLGPYGLAELRQYTTRGKLLADDLVSAAGEVEWTPAAHARALQDLFPKDGSEDATVALEPALRAMAAPPVPARRTSSADNPLRGTTLPPRPPATDAPAVLATEAPAVPAPAVPAPAVPAPPAVTAPAVTAPAVTTPAVTAPSVAPKPAPRVSPTPTAAPAGSSRGIVTGVVIGLVAAASVLVLDRVIARPQQVPTARAVITAPTAPDAGALRAATPTAAVDAGAPAHAAVHDAGAPGAAPAGHTGVARTRETLRALEALMAGAVPPADPFDYTTLAEPCLTGVARANDRRQGALDAARAAEGLRLRQAAEARQASRARQWLAMAWTWDRDWRTRSVNRSATYGCYDGAWSDEPLETCPGEWRRRTEALSGSVYLLDGQATQPELHRRVEAAAGVHPEAEQFCEVRDAQLTSARLTVTCAGDGPAGYELWLPRELAAPTGGALAGVMVGDVLRVDGHRVLKREADPATAPGGAGRWSFQEVPATGVSIVEHARRCTVFSAAAR